jgi:SPX domain protein involved in polyphosphate accumulation
VQEFVQAQAAHLSSALEALAAAAPRLAAADAASLERQAQQLGRQLLALEGFVQLNEAGFVKIVKKHDKVSK